MGVGAGLLLLTITSLGLIWKGITGDVMTTRLGDTLVTRWMYVVGGLVLLVFPTVWVLLQTEGGRGWLMQ